MSENGEERMNRGRWKRGLGEEGKGTGRSEREREREVELGKMGYRKGI